MPRVKKYDKTMLLFLTSEQFEALTRRAERMGLKRGPYIRRRLGLEEKPEPKDQQQDQSRTP